MAALSGYRPLRLLVEDGEDLKFMSTILQDAVAKIGDFGHLPRQRRFAFVANRFVWECVGGDRRGPFARVRVGCHFDDVVGVRHLNLRVDAKNGVVDLLAIRFEPGADGSGAVTLDFAGGGAIQLNVESVNARLADISRPWAAKSRPEHDAA